MSGAVEAKATAAISVNLWGGPGHDALGPRVERLEHFRLFAAPHAQE
jgi:hypothetical protein